MEFEWDVNKDLFNTMKHGVRFEEAASVFGDPLAITYGDPDHSQEEQRFITIGMSARKRLVFVAHTNRSDTIRIISARCAVKRERTLYEEG